jgi:hypothetical protein
MCAFVLEKLGGIDSLVYEPSAPAVPLEDILGRLLQEKRT